MFLIYKLRFAICNRLAGYLLTESQKLEFIFRRGYASGHADGCSTVARCRNVQIHPFPSAAPIAMFCGECSGHNVRLVSEDWPIDADDFLSQRRQIAEDE